MKHLWVEDICIKCGISREKRSHERFLYEYSALKKSGIFEDVKIYVTYFEWWYGEKHGFTRPDCTKSMFVHRKNEAERNKTGY